MLPLRVTTSTIAAIVTTLMIPSTMISAMPGSAPTPATAMGRARLTAPMISVTKNASQKAGSASSRAASRDAAQRSLSASRARGAKMVASGVPYRSSYASLTASVSRPSADRSRGTAADVKACFEPRRCATPARMPASSGTRSAHSGA